MYLYFPVVGRWYGCDVGDDVSFSELLNTLKPFLESEMKGLFCMHGDMIIREYTKDLPCDKDVSLLSAGVRTGMSFVIY